MKMTVREVANRLNVSIERVKVMIQDGVIPGAVMYVGNHNCQFYISAERFEQWLAERKGYDKTTDKDL